MAEEQLKKAVVDKVKQGKTVEEIKDELNLKSVVRVKNLYMEGLMEEGEIPQLKKKERKTRQIDVRTIGKSGTSLSRKLLVDVLGFEEGDRFKAKREGNNIVLEKL